MPTFQHVGIRRSGRGDGGETDFARFCSGDAAQPLPQRGLSAREPPPPRPLCKPLGPPAPLVAIPLEVVYGPTQLVVADPDLPKELLNV